MPQIRFELKEEFIPLISLLKYTGIAESGAMASEMVISGEVTCNGATETRKRYKVRKGDTIVAAGTEIAVI